MYNLLVVFALLVANTLALEPPITRTLVLRGTVTSAAGQPLGGASVRASVNHSAYDAGAIVAANGSYQFSVSAPDTITSLSVLARYIGYKPQQQFVRVSGDTIVANFKLERDFVNLEEVVV